MKVGEAIAYILGCEGVDTLIGYPVSPLIEPAAAAGIRPIIVRQERTGLHMADSMSRMTSGKRIGVFTMQSGPGTENAFGGVAQAYADSVPILVIAAGHDRREMTTPPNFSAYLNYRNVTKWIDQLVLPETVVPTMRRAFARLRNGRPRPVLVEVPWDVWYEDCPDPTGYVPPITVRSAPDPADVERAADALVAAERPILYAGQGVHYAEAWPELRALAELLAAPVTTSLQGKSAFPEDHPLSLGSGGRTVPRPLDVFMGEADLVFGIGASFTKTGYGLQWPADKRYIHATLDPADLDQVVPVEVGLVGDARLTLAALLEAVGDRIREPRTERAATIAARIAGIRAEWLADWDIRRRSDAAPMSPYRVMADLAATVDVAQHDHHPRRRQPARPDLPVLAGHDTAVVHRLGQVHPAGLRPGPRDRGEAGPPGPPVHQRHGRRGVRDDRPRLRDRRPRADPDPDDRPQQLLDGDRAGRDADLDRALPLDRHRRRLRGDRPRPRRLGRAGDRAVRDRRGGPARRGRDRGRPAGAARVHHLAGGLDLDARVDGALKRLKRPSSRYACREHQTPRSRSPDVSVMLSSGIKPKEARSPGASAPAARSPSAARPSRT